MKNSTPIRSTVRTLASTADDKDKSILSADATIRVSSHIRRRVCRGEAVYEKQYTTDDWGGTAEVIRKRAEREYRLLQDLQSSGLFRRRLGVVRVASCDPQQATIATHEIIGQPLGSWLRDGSPRRKSLRPWYLAGAWLRTFQSLPIPESAFERLSEKDSPCLVHYCDLRLRSIREEGYPWPDAPTHRRLLRAIEKVDSGKEDWQRQQVWVHADYAPGNLLWGGGVLTPIDFATARTGGPLEDATYLIHRLEMQRVYRPWLRLPTAAFAQAILRGLGRPQADKSPGYKALMIRHLVCRLHTYVRRPPCHLRQSVHDRWVRAVVRRRLLAAAESGGPDV